MISEEFYEKLDAALAPIADEDRPCREARKKAAKALDAYITAATVTQFKQEIHPEEGGVSHEITLKKHAADLNASLRAMTILDPSMRPLLHELTLELASKAGVSLH